MTLLVMLGVLIWVFFNVKVWERSEEHGGLISYDVTSYYSYLPAYFIHDDLTFRFVDTDSIDYRKESKFFPVEVPGSDKYVVKMTMGMSFLYAPFFGLAHLIASNNDHYSADGFSAIYEFFLGLSSIFYTMIGFIFLRFILLKYFSEIIASLVMLLVLFGTNLFYYCTTEPAMSHAYSFAMIAALLFFTIKWLDKQNWRYMMLIGLLGGLIVLVRPVNILVFIVILLYAVNNKSDFVKRVSLLKSEYWQLLVFAFSAFLVVLPQLVFWKFNTGNWIFYSYSEEQIYWTNPHVLDGLFSYRKGWFLYTPVMLLACIGIYFSLRLRKEFVLGLVIFLPIFIYVTFSWWCWWYGGSFGARSMIDIYAFMALPLGVLLVKLKDDKLFKWGGVVIFTLLIGLNLIQTQQKRLMVLHWDSMTKEAYWGTFLKLDDPKNYEDLYRAPEYDKALKGEDEY